jgi:hypothetical protein
MCVSVHACVRIVYVCEYMTSVVEALRTRPIISVLPM